MKPGWALPQLGVHSGADQIASFARVSEQLGYASLWVGDRVLAPVAPSDLYPGGGTPQRSYPPEFRSILDPVVVLAAAAASTTMVRLDVGFGIGWLDLQFATSSVDDSLSIAADVMSKVGALD